LKNALLRAVIPIVSRGSRGSGGSFTACLPALLPACALLALPMLASGVWAQARVTDPAAPVPPVVYQSVFADTPKGVETQTADWKRANAEVGQFKRGHIDILKWEEAQTQKQMPLKKQLPTQSPPQVPDAAKPAAPNMHKH